MVRLGSRGSGLNDFGVSMSLLGLDKSRETGLGSI